ncbi:MAG: hypothetical protein FJ171_07615 [Gammaproteobacteria bacterium]|nr:hypothetical protein [Gammaproteobacteria bacterium]
MVLLLLCALPLTMHAQELPAPEPEIRPAPADGCEGEVPADPKGIDSLRAGLHRGVCSTARYVDRMFGRDNQFSEYQDASNGRAGVTLGWDEHDNFEVDTRLRASVSLPQINERFSATIGRASQDEFLADESGAFNSVVGAFTDDEPAEWFAGVGYGAHRGRDSRFDLGAGLKLESPLNPYGNARYRHYIYRPSGVLLTLRTTFFVENDEGFGVTQAFDVDKVLGDAYLFRLSSSARLSEDTDGVRWRIRPALYQAFDYRRAMRYEAFVRGETDGTQPDLYGVALTHRRSVLREWLFLEFGAELFWADGPTPSDRCDSCVGAAIGFEIVFGEAYDRLLRRDASRLPVVEKPADADRM